MIIIIISFCTNDTSIEELSHLFPVKGSIHAQLNCTNWFMQCSLYISVSFIGNEEKLENIRCDGAEILRKNRHHYHY